MRVVRVVALLVLSLCGSVSFALTCDGGRDLGRMGPPDLEAFGNSFSSAGDHTDCYTFKVSGSAASVGGVWDFFDPRIDIESVALYALDEKNEATLLQRAKDPLAFSFGALINDVVYALAVVTDVAKASKYSPAGYAGLFRTYAAPVPEASALAMLLVGLIGVGLVARRRMR